MNLLLFPYHCLMELRNLLFFISKPFKVQTSFVISVGNITFGGTGKTPIVMTLAEKYLKEGKSVAVVSRGYKRKSKKEIILAPNADNFTVEEIGDEPYMIKKRLPTIWLGVGANRKSVIQKLPKVDYIILDDGFQKLSIARDLNILLIDATKPFYLLREFFKNIKRADLIIITKSNLVEDTSKIEKKIKNIPIIKSEYLPIIKNLPQVKKVSLLTAIGNPEAFEKTVKNLGYEIEHRYFFPDHHWFTENDLTNLQGEVLTTEKDAVKLNKNFYVLRMEATIPENFSKLNASSNSVTQSGKYK